MFHNDSDDDNPRTSNTIDLDLVDVDEQRMEVGITKDRECVGYSFIYV